MERTETISSVITDSGSVYIIHNPSVSIKNRLQNFIGIPKSIEQENIDNEQYSWCMLVVYNKLSMD